MNYDIQCYLQKDDGTSLAINSKSRWGGMYNLETKGLADYGKAKNIVTESYAEGDGVRAYLPPSSEGIKREATDVSLKMLFIDHPTHGSRYEQYDDFIAYVENDVIIYWDSVRKRKARLLFTEKSSPEENFKGNLPYIIATIKFKNIDGYSEQLERWAVAWSGIVCVRVDGYNNGQARRKNLTASLGNTSIPFDFLAAFGSQEAITATDLADMSDSDYLARLGAFSNYVYSYMATAGYVDFADDVISVTNGSHGASSQCQINSEWNGGEPEE